MSLRQYLPQSTRGEHNFDYGHRCYAFDTIGIVSYDPVRPNKMEKGWCIIEVHKDLTRYYRALFKKEYGVSLFAPAFDAHLSVLKGDVDNTPKMMTDWKYLDKKEVTICYDPNLYWNDKHVWINTYCDEYFAIREYYNVPNWNTREFGHITIGKFQG